MFIVSYVITKEECENLLLRALIDNEWNYTDSEIDSTLTLDSVFLTDKKFIPEWNPANAVYNSCVPLEKSLYGSNFIGNYYVFELFSKKKILSSLEKSTIEKIQSEIRSSKLRYKLNELHDRIGNVLIKCPVEIIKYEPVHIGRDMDIALKFIRCFPFTKDDKFLLQHRREHDSLIYENTVLDMDFTSKEEIVYEFPCNHMKNQISIINLTSGLTLFSYECDYSLESNYLSQISPPQLYTTTHPTRMITIGDKRIEIRLYEHKPQGELYRFTEMREAEERIQAWKDQLFFEKRYILSYEVPDRQQAITDLISIINNNLLWDLKEIILVDPYLSPKDILETVVYCTKPSVTIKCITDLRNTVPISGIELENIKSKDGADLKNDEPKDNIDFSSYLKKCSEILQDSLGSNCDIFLEYRTQRGEHGLKFHDRYLILKYDVNRPRVWSLGASINSLGTMHHSIQIVEAPYIISNYFEKMWKNIDHEECNIYKSPKIIEKENKTDSTL